VLAATNCGLGAVPGSPQAMIVLASPFRFYSPTYFHRHAPALYGGLTARDLSVRDRMRASRSQFPPSHMGYAMQILGGASWTSRHFLHEIDVETLVISGDDDPLIPLCNAEYLASRIQNARLEVVAQAGHLFLCDEPQGMAERIRNFVDSPVSGHALTWSEPLQSANAVERAGRSSIA
jgi:pimeloyl-ACP methyl ester carboxylesterase